MNNPLTNKAVSFKIKSYCEHNHQRHIKDGKFSIDDLVYHCQIKYLDLLESQDERFSNPEAKSKHLVFISETVKDWYANYQTLSNTKYKPSQINIRR